MEAKDKVHGLADQATLDLRDYIVKNKFKPGDLLPGEIELSEKLGVSRTIIREALSKFRMMGVIDSRRRRGMILQSPDILKGMELAMNGRWLKRETLQDMFEFRLMLELGLADFIFGPDKEHLIKKLERIIEKEEKAKTGPQRMKADAEFHAALYDGTENSSLVRIQKLLYPLFVRYASKTIRDKFPAAVGHKHLLEELKSGTPESFRTAMRKHLEPHFEVRERRIK